MTVAPPAPRKRAQTKSPAFQFYPSNFLGSPKVRAMDAAQIGVYWLLCCIEWEESGFTIEEAQDIAASARVAPLDFGAMWPKIARCFVERDGRFFSPRLDAERAKQKAWRRKSSTGGKISAEKRRKGGSTTVQPPPQPTGNTPSLSPTPVTTTTAERPAKPVERPSDAVFEEAWAVYPKRPNNSKPAAYRQWLARVAEGVDPLDMLEGTRRYAKLVAAEGTEPRYVKLAATFYGRDRHFESDFTPSSAPDSLEGRVASLMAEEDAAIEKTKLLLASRLAS